MRENLPDDSRFALSPLKQSVFLLSKRGAIEQEYRYQRSDQCGEDDRENQQEDPSDEWIHGILLAGTFSPDVAPCRLLRPAGIALQIADRSGAGHVLSCVPRAKPLPRAVLGTVWGM